MTVAHDYDDLHHLVDRLPPDQARRLLRLVESDPELSAYAHEETTLAEEPGEAGAMPARLSFVGSVEGGPADLAERSRDYLLEYFNNSL